MPIVLTARIPDPPKSFIGSTPLTSADPTVQIPTFQTAIPPASADPVVSINSFVSSTPFSSADPAVG